MTVNHETKVRNSMLRNANTTMVATYEPEVARDVWSSWLAVDLYGLRFALGFEFLWAFLDKSFGLGYSTPNARAWIHGGSPTTGFLTGASAGPFRGFFHSLAGSAVVDWLFTLGLLGVGLAFILGMAIRPAAFFGAVILAMMWFAVWVPAKMAAGQPTGSANTTVDEHIIGILAFIVVGSLATLSSGFLGRRWGSSRLVQSHPWLR